MPWWAGGLANGAILTVATGLVEPIGVSTQYAVFDGVWLNSVAGNFAARRSCLEQMAEEWTRATYEFFFVLGIPLGAFFAALATKRWRPRADHLSGGAAFKDETGCRYGMRQNAPAR